jgi:hypothetical protein
VEGLAEALKDHVTGKWRVREIPKGQRLIGRLSLNKLFEKAGKTKAKRDRLTAEAVNQHGHSQVEVACHIQVHHSSVNRLMKGASKSSGSR